MTTDEEAQNDKQQRVILRNMLAQRAIDSATALLDCPTRLAPSSAQGHDPAMVLIDQIDRLVNIINRLDPDPDLPW